MCDARDKTLFSFYILFNTLEDPGFINYTIIKKVVHKIIKLNQLQQMGIPAIKHTYLLLNSNANVEMNYIIRSILAVKILCQSLALSQKLFWIFHCTIHSASYFISYYIWKTNNRFNINLYHNNNNNNQLQKFNDFWYGHNQTELRQIFLVRFDSIIIKSSFKLYYRIS